MSLLLLFTFLHNKGSRTAFLSLVDESIPVDQPPALDVVQNVSMAGSGSAETMDQEEDEPPLLEITGNSGNLHVLPFVYM